MSSCGCKVTSCKGCVCTQNQKQCNERCKCNPNRCENRPVISHNNQNTAMDQDALTAALAHLMANQQLQQHQFQMQQQMQQQQDVLTALANRLLAAPAAAVPVVAAPAPAAIIRTTLDSDIRYAGSDNESLQGWLQLINRKALAEGWQDADKRRAAISSLFGKALTWHEEIGINLPQWDDWIGSLRGTFEIQLTESQWQKLVEERKQLPNETGSAYVLDKVKLCRRRAIPINDAEMTPYLIRGLYRPEIRSVLMGNPPATVNDFLVELRRLEAITAGAAINEQKALKPTNLALIGVHIARVGPVEAMVDTGAMFSVIEKRMIQHLLKEEFLVGGTLLSFNKERVPIVGEIPLTVRFKDRVVDLQKVRVVEQALFPLILGVDWMGKSNVGVRPSPGDRCQMEAIIFPETTTNNTDEKLKKEKTDDGNGMLAAITLSPAIPPTRAKRYVMEPCVIPAKTMKFVHVSIEETNSETMMVERAHSAFPNREWIVPHCLVSVEGKHVRVPVTNLSNEPLMLKKGQKLTRINPWGVDEETENKDEVCGTLGEENTYLPDEIKEKMTNQAKITTEQKIALHKMLDKYAGCFSNEGKIGVDAGHAHRIDTGDARPVSARPRRISMYERQIITEQVRSMLSKGIIEPSNSPWSANVVLIKKKDGNLRFCVDYRPLNAVTKKDVYPMPRPDDLIQKVAGAAIFSSMDIKNAFWEVPVHPEDREKTAFVTTDGLYQFKYLPFGLCNSPATFVRIIDHALLNLKWTHCLAYIDDILVFGSNLKEHQMRLEAVLTAFQNSNITLNVEKCSFCVPHVKFLGHLVDGEGLRPDPQKIAAINKFPTPVDVSSLKSFLGLASYYRRFILQFALMAAPLHQLLKKEVPWKWELEHQIAMRKLQDALLAAPNLAHDDDDGDLVLKTDASKFGLGAVLNRVKEKVERPMIFISRRTSKAEMNYHSNALECLALVWALDKLKPYVYGRNFTVFTDNSALKWLYSKKDIDGKYARWILALQEFQIQIKHIKGHLNVVADALSRFPVGDPEDTDLPEAMCCVAIGSFHPPEEIALLQHDDKATRLIRMKLREDGAAANESYALKKDVLYRNNRQAGRKLLLVVPSFLRREVLSTCHDDPSAGHMGIAKTYHKLAERYWWKGSWRSVKSYVSSCGICQFNKPISGRSEGKLMSIPAPSTPFHTLGMDHIGPFLPTPRGNIHALVMMDYLSKWIIAIPSTCERPQTNGQVERANRTLVSTIKSYVNLSHDDWDLHIPMATLAINSARQSTTKRSPFELIYGRTPVLSRENAFPWPVKRPERVKQFFRRVTRWRAEASKLISDSQNRSKRLLDPRRRNDRQYIKGDLVLVQRNIRKKGMTKKFLPKFIGPFEIVKKVCPITYLVEDPPTRRKRQIWRRFNAHVAQIRPFRAPNETEWHPEDSESDTENEHTEEEHEPSKSAQNSNEPGDNGNENRGNSDVQPARPTPRPEGTVTRAGRRTYPPAWRLQDIN
ncbi:Uncharacterized protein APZ42_012348 [Daphnia magna]|uniref:RNA-directed DNA polymerase n=1 Tax=Daphnia magna TaxID=35525 RepID=A0A162RXA7_9CRUS|nr:Uncharacterized protein APZ42_012348 [Daphnia magna]